MAKLLGLSSGTSMDGIDAALVEIGGDRIELLHYAERPYSPDLRASLQDIVARGHATLDTLGAVHVRVGREFAEAALALLAGAGIEPAQITGIGSHGQTIRHSPQGAYPSTLQIGDGSSIAARTGIPTACDFRSKDVALGGQGAPLVPPFHAALFATRGEARAILNVGGIANVTLLEGEPRSVVAFDTGPGNTLIDRWTFRHMKAPFDADGAWSRTGAVHEVLLHRLLQDPYFSRPPPKSTGLETFNLDWVVKAPEALQIPPRDVARTLVELTAKSAADQILAQQPATRRVLLCGGGAKNSLLRERLGEAMGRIAVEDTGVLGVPPEALEAMAFAWLGYRRLRGVPGNLPQVTGASREAVLGAVYLP